MRVMLKQMQLSFQTSAEIRRTFGICELQPILFAHCFKVREILLEGSTLRFFVDDVVKIVGRQ